MFSSLKLLIYKKIIGILLDIILEIHTGKKNQNQLTNLQESLFLCKFAALKFDNADFN